MEEYLGRSINEVGHKFREAVRCESNRRGIPSSYFKILMYLGIHKDKKTQTEITEFAQFKPSTISVTLQNMERDGYIFREKDEKDKRVTFILLTNKGKEAAALIKEVFDNIEKDIIDSFSDSQLEIFRTALKAVFERLEKWVI